MQTETLGIGRGLARLGIAVRLLTASLADTVLAQGGSQPAPPVAGCSWSPPRAATGGVADEAEEDDGNDPRIVGTVRAPAGMREDNQDALASLVSISEDRAVEIALAAIPDAQRRRVREVELEIEQGYVVWGVETELQRGESGPDRIVEVIVDAGSGQVLYVECEDDDD